MSNRINLLAATPTIERQTQRSEFGEVLKSTLERGASMVSGVLMNSVPGVPALSSAIGAVTSMLNNAPRTGSVSQAQTGIAANGIVNVGGVTSSGGGSAVSTTLADTAGIGGMGDSIRMMRAEADRSMQMQLMMQNESREYNALSNVIKVRHDSAKAAINNIR